MKFMILQSNEICWILICLWRVKIIMCILFCSKCWYMIQPTGYLPKRHWIIFTLQTLTSQPYRPPPSRVRSPSYNLHKLGVLPTAFPLITGTKHTDLSSSPLTFSSCIVTCIVHPTQTLNLLNCVAWNRYRVYICTTTNCCMGRYSRSLY